MNGFTAVTDHVTDGDSCILSIKKRILSTV